MFNYIITIHNSAAHLNHVLRAVNAVRGPGSEVYCILDGCTDDSEAIVDSFGFHKIITPDVRETAAINAALSQIPQIGYNLILQDDVVIQDDEIELHVKQAYEKLPNIGVLSLRHGANFEPDALTNGKHASETDLIQSEFQDYFVDVPTLLAGHATERHVVYKSPICISSEVIGKLGGYDKRFEPIAHDDTEYCIRARMAGYKNYVYALDVIQPIPWGGTRRNKKVHSDNIKMHVEHMDLIRQLYPNELNSPRPPRDNIKIWTI